jgi:hypothetical protein
MAEILKYIGKGNWIEIDKNKIKSVDIIKKNVKKGRYSKEEKLENFLYGLSVDIFNNGYKSIKISTLLSIFGISKRSKKNVEEINNVFKEKGFYTTPEYSIELNIESSIRIYNYPVKQLGEFFSSEEALEEYVYKNEKYKLLSIKKVSRQHSPKGTKDRLDFKGETENNEIVVLELKNKGGEKSAVEQVLRYAGLLKNEYPNHKIRQILVTGIQNYETALAIKGMQKEQKEMFEWYIYKYIKESDLFEFHRVIDIDV